MSTSSPYCTSTDFAAWAMNDQSIQVIEESLVTLVISAASSQIEQYCNREAPGFNQDATTSSRVYPVENPYICWVDDIYDSTSVSVAVDLDGDGTFEQSWASTDFQLEPVNAVAKGRPYNLLRSRGRARWFPAWGTGGYATVGHNSVYVGDTFGLLVKGVANVQVTAKWGWPAVPDTIKNATLIQAHHLYTTRGTPLGVLQTPDIGATRVTSLLHPTVRALLEDYRKTEGPLV